MSFHTAAARQTHTHTHTRARARARARATHQHPSDSASPLCDAEHKRYEVKHLSACHFDGLAVCSPHNNPGGQEAFDFGHSH